MEKLEKKHLYSYLPYKVLIYYTGTGKPFRGTKKKEVLTCENFELMFFSTQRKIALIPLSNLTKEIEHNGEKFVPLNYLSAMRGLKINWSDKYLLGRITRAFKNNIKTQELGYNFILKLLEWHFDIFGLIEKGLAINKNEL